MLTDRLRSGGINYEIPAIFEKSLGISDPVGRCPVEGRVNDLDPGHRRRLDNALHGRPSAQRRRPVARSGEARARPVVEENLITDLSKAYELLGVKPGVSSRELKAAHRDLAKVWHPDRFLHDPRLQEKAQEKLKEINEAYELLSMGPRPAPSRPAQTVYS